MKFGIAMVFALATLTPAMAQPTPKQEMEFLKAAQSKLRAELEKIEGRVKELASKDQGGNKPEAKKDEPKKGPADMFKFAPGGPGGPGGQFFPMPGPGGFGPGGPGGQGFRPMTGPFKFEIAPPEAKGEPKKPEGRGPKEEPKKDPKPETRGPGGFGPGGFGPGGYGGRGFGPMGMQFNPTQMMTEMKKLVELLEGVAKDPRSPYAKQAGEFAAKMKAFAPKAPEPKAEVRPEPRGERRPEPRSEPRGERRPEPRSEPRGERRPEPRTAEPTGGSKSSVDARLERLEKAIEEIRNELRRSGGGPRR